MKHWRCLIAAGMLVALIPADAQQPARPAGESPAVEEQKAGEPNDAEAAANSAATPVVIVETPEQAAHAEERERKADEHEAADLKAQRDAAGGALRAAASAERQEVSTFVLSIVGTIVAVTALVMSIRTSRRADAVATTQIRAYVGYVGPGMIGFPGRRNEAAVHPLQFHLGFKNFGQTPAKRLRYSAWTLVRPNPLPAGQSIFEGLDTALNPNDGTKSVMELAAGATQRGIGDAERTFTGAELDAILKPGGAEALYCAGVIKYWDVFGQRERTTRFCHRIECRMNFFDWMDRTEGRPEQVPDGLTAILTAHDNESD